ncbi:hypothetical protein P3T73_07720 [Kiritimatiellota bacterium B12222]|nr:hypothetical protein P3T73_07720 [Kiritimatiellota bacterium B12222]
MKKTTLISGYVWLLAWMLGGLQADEVIELDWGPFASEWHDVSGNQRQRYLGPFVEYIESPEEDTALALRPLFHTWLQKDQDFRRTEIVWPLYVYRIRENSSYWRFLLNFGWNWDVNDSNSRWRLWLLPFYFQGRDVNGENYMALFPLGGSIREFAFWDRIDFALFPLAIRSYKKKMVTNTLLWPIFSKTTGPGSKRMRVFPFYGFTEYENVGRKTFILWPFYTQVNYMIPQSLGKGWILFPLFGHMKLSDQETWWFIPPLFRYSVGEEQNRIYGPWPLFQKESGVVDKFYLFPLYGRKESAGYKQQFFLWPLGHYESAERDTGTRKKFYFFPFVQYYYANPSEWVSPTPDGETTYLKIWPLFSNATKHSGDSHRFAFFDFNPMKGGPIERNYAAFWQVYVYARVDDRVDKEVLWGFYRSAKRGDDYQYRSLFPFFNYKRDRNEDEKHFQLFKGLIGRQRVGEKKRWQFLYLFHFGDKDLAQ